MTTKNRHPTLFVFAYDSASILDALFFEVYTRLRMTPKQAGNTADGRHTPILGISYCYINSEKSGDILNDAFDIVFRETLKYRKFKKKKSSIDNYGQ